MPKKNKKFINRHGKKILLIAIVLALIGGVTTIVLFRTGVLGRETEFFCRFNSQTDVQFFPRSYSYNMPYDDRGKAFSVFFKADRMITKKKTELPIGYEFSLQIAFQEIATGTTVLEQEWLSHEAIVAAEAKKQVFFYLENDYSGITFYDMIGIPITPSFKGGTSYRMITEITFMLGGMSKQTINADMRIDVQPPPSTPTVEITSPPIGTTFTEGEEVTVEWSYSADNGLDHFELNTGDGYTDVGSATSATFTAPGVTKPSTMKVSVKVVDSKGWYAIDDISLAIVEDLETTEPPTMTTPKTTTTPTTSAPLMVVPAIVTGTICFILTRKKRKK